MKSSLSFKFCFNFVLGFFAFGFAQQSKVPHQNSLEIHEKCGFSDRHRHLMQSDPAYVLRRQQEESHIENYVRSANVDKAVKTIPVVVHIIHLGEAVGTGTNISTAQIQSAIDNMNDAYRNQAPYTGVDTEIEFCLAQRDPNGNPTTGIVRVNGTGVTNYSSQGIISSNEQAVKGLSKWDNTKYYNFWIVSEIDNNNGGSGTQGYAYFPGAGSQVDGAVMLYNAFGYDPTGSLGYNLKSYTNKNVTAIHEMGHALNLYHTFEGDGSGSTCPVGNGCGSNVGDCVGDTPPHRRSNSDCNTSGTNPCDGGSSNSLFVHDFMDYSSDVCQTEFTAGQSSRMNATLTGGGLRASLAASEGCNPADNQNDASITSIVSPISSYCQTTFSPQVTLRNFGLNTLVSVTINYNIDGGTNQVYDWVGSLVSGASEVVTLNPVTTTSGTHTFTASTSLPNGSTDEYTPNNTSSISFTITSSSSLPFAEDFEGAFPPANWSVYSADTYMGDPWNTDPSIRQWEKRAVVQSTGTSGNAAAINFAAYGYNAGSIDELISPSINLGTAVDPDLTFQLAYKYYGASNYERLRVLISTDCGVNYTPVYDKSYTQLANAGQASTSWSPTSAANWRLETIDLAAYAGEIIKVKFEGTNGYGNNLYIDKINVFDNCAPPVITSSPANRTNCSGTNASFTVANTNGGTYQWQVNTGSGFVSVANDAVYSGATSATLTITGANTGMSGNLYRVVITNACGSATSTSATLTVNATPAAPTITAGGPTTFCEGGFVVLTSSSLTGNVWSTGGTTQSINVTTSQDITLNVVQNGCSSVPATQTITVNDCSAVAEHDAALFLVYPNPAKGSVIIAGEKIKSLQSLKLYDATGRSVKEMIYTGSENIIDLSMLSNGVYTLVLTGDHFTEKVKIHILR